MIILREGILSLLFFQKTKDPRKSVNLLFMGGFAPLTDNSIPHSFLDTDETQ
jgi:hypothetical protein